MPEPILNADQIKALASEQAAQIIAAKDRETALATHLATLHNANASLQLQLAEAGKTGSEMEKNLEILKKQKKEADEQYSSASAKVTELTEALTAAEAAKKKVEEEKYKLLEDNKAKATELNKIQSAVAAENRKTQLAAAGLATAKLVARATATNSDGLLAMSNEDFTSLIEEAKEIAEAALAAKTGNVGNGDGKGADGAPSPSPTPAINPGEVNPPSNNVPLKVPQGAGASVTPAAPTLATASQEQVTNLASLLSGGVTATQDGRSRMAALFPINERR